jgi:predicted alpha-1,2-mannosidase
LKNPKWPAAAASDTYYDDIFTFWDLHRCSLALTQLITPTAHTEQMASLVNIFKHEGWMPDARSSNANGETQGGSNADNVLADAYVKGVNIDWNTAFQAMKKDASVTPPNNQDPRAPDSSTLEGRGALPDWLQYGYITLNNFSRSVSRGVEYAANDFSVYQLAAGLHKNNAYTYLNRSRNWRNYFNPAQTSTIGNATYAGFLVPKYANGSFEYPYDPIQCGGCYWADPYYEALPWEYLFSSRNHDMAHLITLLGGPDAFVSRLETLMAFHQYSGNSQFNNTLINPGNEPSFNTPYLFNFAPNSQHRTVYHSRQINTLYYNEGTGGIPGNSDAGAMQTYQLWNMIGLYPMVSTTTFLISAPWFESMTINLEDILPATSTATATAAKKKPRILKITATGILADVKQIVYVQSLKVNGVPWNKAWVTWSDIFEVGGTMEYVMAESPNLTWANGPLPPSPAS